MFLHFINSNTLKHVWSLSHYLPGRHSSQQTSLWSSCILHFLQPSVVCSALHRQACRSRQRTITHWIAAILLSDLQTYDKGRHSWLRKNMSLSNPRNIQENPTVFLASFLSSFFLCKSSSLFFVCPNLDLAENIEVFKQQSSEICCHMKKCVSAVGSVHNSHHSQLSVVFIVLFFSRGCVFVAQDDCERL